MRSLRQQILVLMLASLVLLAASFILILGFHMRERAISAAIIKAQSDLATCAEIINLKYPGEWRAENGNLYKGESLISLQNDVVDSLAELTGDTVTIFLNDTRVTTTVRGSDGERAIGTKVSDAVAKKVLKNGDHYLGEANVVGQIYQTAYEPIRDAHGNILGMLYVGISRSYTQELIVNSLWQTAILGVGITLVVSLLAWFFIERVIIRPLRNITLGTRDLATGHITNKVEVSGPKEIGELASAFNQMIERLENLARGLENRIPSKDAVQLTLNEEVVEKNEEVKGNKGEPIEQKINVEFPTEIDDLNPQDEHHEIDSSPHHRFNYREYVEEHELPKGLNKATLIQIMNFLSEQEDFFSAEDVAEGVKLTRVTVRRYLEFLEHSGELTSQLKYGTVGRPVRIWCRNNT
ncbi:MAG: signal protein [Firmicutes bacterium]|nr:signal protein [Bacillota bacterium]